MTDEGIPTWALPLFTDVSSIKTDVATIKTDIIAVNHQMEAHLKRHQDDHNGEVRRLLIFGAGIGTGLAGVGTGLLKMLGT